MQFIFLYVWGREEMSMLAGSSMGREEEGEKPGGGGGGALPL